MSTKRSSSVDALTAQLSGIVSSPRRAGIEQADKALKQKVEKNKTERFATEEPTPSKKTKVSKASEVVTKTTLSLHPQDLARLDEIQKAMMDSGISIRGTNLSFLVKVGIAGGLKASKNELREIIQIIQRQDCRRK